MEFKKEEMSEKSRTLISQKVKKKSGSQVEDLWTKSMECSEEEEGRWSVGGPRPGGVGSTKGEEMEGSEGTELVAQVEKSVEMCH